MRKLITFCLLITLLAGSAISGIFHFGFRAGMDMGTIDKEEERLFPFGENAADLSYATVERQEISNPYMFGGQFGIDVLPFIDIEAYFDVAMKSYKYTVQTWDEIGGSEGLDLVDQEITYFRYHYGAAVKYPFDMLPVIKPFIGVGIGGVGRSPLATKNLVKDELNNYQSEWKESDFLNIKTEVCPNIVGGIKIDPPMIPLLFTVEGRYLIIDEGDYKEMGNVLSVFLTASLAF